MNKKIILSHYFFAFEQWWLSGGCLYRRNQSHNDWGEGRLSAVCIIEDGASHFSRGSAHNDMIHGSLLHPRTAPQVMVTSRSLLDLWLSSKSRAGEPIYIAATRHGCSADEPFNLSIIECKVRTTLVFPERENIILRNENVNKQSVSDDRRSLSI